MKFTRNAKAHWTGTGKDGKGTVTTGSGVLKDSPYGFKSRFEEGPGTNPEELIGAAHAGCFSMKLAFNLQEAGFSAERIDTKAGVVFENGAITEVQLQTSVKAQGLTADKLEQLVNDAKQNCPISKLLNAKISVTYQLVS